MNPKLISTILAILVLFGTTPTTLAQEINPSLVLDDVEIPYDRFNMVARDAPVVKLPKVHETSWQATIDNNLHYNTKGSAGFRLYDANRADTFVEVGMGSPPDNLFWVGVQLPDEGYFLIHHNLERGWSKSSKVIISYTDRAGLTVNNGARIVVTNLDIGKFAIEGYSTFGKEGTNEPDPVRDGFYHVEFLSGDPAQNIFHLYPFFLAAGIGILVGILFITKKRS